LEDASEWRLSLNMIVEETSCYWCGRDELIVEEMIVGVWVPEGCRHKAVVQCQGQRAGREQARRDLQASNISE
jgi:hypothetical protein